jgi:UDP-3-O-[3-hydroxymyristoyl] N-acetylglucosamine deacetylase
MRKGHILILDDDARSVQALTVLLKGAGFDVLGTDDVSTAMACLHNALPDVVLLELWLPEMDGIAILQAIKSRGTDTAVIMMSGHGNITTAVYAMQLGAFDFLEKPLLPETVLHTVYRALHDGQSATPQQLPRIPKQGEMAVTSSNPQSAIRNPQAQASPQPQRTLRRSLVLRGQGLQSGYKTGLILSPMPSGSGIVFRDLVTGDLVPATVEYVASMAFCTSLHKGRVRINTIEHLMSALHAFGLTNLLVTVSDEVPIMDGSAADFCRLIDDAGITEQDAVAESYPVERCYHIGGSSLHTKFIRIDPYDGFRVTYRASYPAPIGIQEWTYEHRNSASYCSEVAPARTFAFIKDVEAMHAAGLVAGGRLNNVILIGDANIVNTAPLHFANEWVRHKVLDIIGDLYLLGMPIRGHVRANMTGHTENIELVRQLRQALGSA